MRSQTIAYRRTSGAPLPTSWKIALLVPICAMVSYHDLRRRTIPNAIPLLAIIAALVAHGMAAGTAGTMLSLEGCAVGFAITIGLYVFNLMGAGDVKLFAAAAAIVGYGHVLLAWKGTVLAGGLLAFIALIWSISRKTEIPTIPYGIAIANGSLASVLFWSTI